MSTAPRLDAYPGLLIFFMGIFVAGAVATFLQSQAFFDETSTFIVWGTLIVIGGGVAAFYIDRPFDLFSSGFVANLIFMIYYGVSMLSNVQTTTGFYTQEFNDFRPYFAQAGMVSFWCWFLFNIGYMSHFADLVGRRLPLFSFRAPPFGMNALWLALFGLGCMANAVIIVGGADMSDDNGAPGALFNSFFGLLQAAGQSSLALAGVEASRARFRLSSWNLRLAAALMVQIPFGIATGTKTFLILPLIYLLMSINYGRALVPRRVAMVMVLMMPVVGYVVFPLNAIYRELTTQDGVRVQQNFVMAFSTFGDAINKFTSGQTADDITTDYMRARTSSIAVTAAILRYVDEGAKLTLGESYGRIFIAFIPRPFWLDKPDIMLGNEITIRVFHRDPDDATSTGATIVGEAIYNFGPWLAPFVVLIMGGFYRALYQSFKTGFRFDPAVATAIHVQFWYAFYMSNMESNFAGALSGAFKGLIVIVLIGYFFGVQPVLPARHVAPQPRF